jgi:hypothetical protein
MKKDDDGNIILDDYDCYALVNFQIMCAIIIFTLGLAIGIVIGWWLF